MKYLLPIIALALTGSGGFILGRAHEARLGYCADAVDQAIASSNRAARRIGGKEARIIHALLKGRTS